jgi:hypothetical protein
MSFTNRAVHLPIGVGMERVDSGGVAAVREEGVGPDRPVPASSRLWPAQRELTNGDAVARWRWYGTIVPMTRPLLFLVVLEVPAA